jgi:hypothetical protein
MKLSSTLKALANLNAIPTAMQYSNKFSDATYWYNRSNAIAWLAYHQEMQHEV